MPRMGSQRALSKAAETPGQLKLFTNRPEVTLQAVETPERPPRTTDRATQTNFYFGGPSTWEAVLRAADAEEGSTYLEDFMEIYVERIVDKVIDGLTKEEVATFRKKTRKARLQQDHLCAPSGACTSGTRSRPSSRKWIKRRVHL